MNKSILTAAALVTIGGWSLGQSTPATQPAAVQTPQTQDIEALQRQIAKLNADLEMQKQAANRAKADALVPVQPAPAAAVPLKADPVPPALQPLLPPGAHVGISDVELTDTNIDDDAAVHVVANITLDGLKEVPFTMQGVIVTADEQLQTNLRGKPYEASRTVMTRDDSDMDNYSVDIRLKDLFSSPAPADLYVQVRILDQQGRLIEKSELLKLKRLWR